MRFVITCLMLVAVSGCATPLTSYSPIADQEIVYTQGVGAIKWETNEAVLTMYPTFRYQAPSEIPTFTLLVQNKSDHDIDFAPEGIQAWLDDRACHVYTLEERISEIRGAKRRKQIALAVLGGVAAGAAAYGASHQTTTYNSYGTATAYNSYGGVRQTQFYATTTVQTYDPASGILAGAAVGAATGVGIYQIERAAGYQEQAAQAIFQHSTIRPGATVVGQVLLKPTSTGFGTLKMDVPMNTGGSTFVFTKKTTSM